LLTRYFQLIIHADDKGAVWPPRVAEYQVAIVPVGLTARISEADRQKILKDAENIGQTLSEAGIRVECDTREHYSPGWKFNEYEVRDSLSSHCYNDYVIGILGSEPILRLL